MSRANQLSAPTAQKIARIIESAAATGRMPRLQRATRKAKNAYSTAKIRQTMPMPLPPVISEKPVIVTSAAIADVAASRKTSTNLVVIDSAFSRFGRQSS